MTSARLSSAQLRWLVFGHWFLVWPHLLQIPLWIVATSVLTGTWRLAADANLARVPPWPLRLLMACGGVVGIVVSFNTLVGLEPMVGLLLVAAAMKLLECQHQRDGQILVCLGFFLVATHFIYHQSLPMTFYVLVASVALLLTLLRLNMSSANRVATEHLTLVMRMMLWAAPLMATLFILFPRIEPLWAVPAVGRGAVTGMDDRLAPGSVSHLARSDAVAFRVRFNDTPPPRRDWYWRGMVLNQFEQGAWTRTHWRDIPVAEREVTAEVGSGATLKYELLQPATFQRWLFTLPYARASDARVIETATQHVLSRQPIESTSRFDITTHLETVRQRELSSWWREHELSLPEGANPRSEAWMSGLRRAWSDDKALIQAVLRWFREEPFYYTLSPAPIPPADFVDAFLFDQRRGFCEHYAYAFVVLMRQAGIPARIVGGYQGGELNPDTGTIVVRQLDAHAWAEVWLPGEGWVRIDPTAAVAPARVERGVAEALAGEPLWLAESGLSAYRYRHIAWVDWLRWQYDDLAWQWQRGVVSYDQPSQVRALSDWLERIPGVNLNGLLGGIWLVVLGALFVLGRNLPTRSAARSAEKAFSRLCKRLARRGVVRRFGESAPVLLDRAASELGADDPLVQRLSEIAEALYAPPVAAKPVQ